MSAKPMKYVIKNGLKYWEDTQRQWTYAPVLATKYDSLGEADSALTGAFLSLRKSEQTQADVRIVPAPTGTF